jgi:hypothetical protein
MAQASLSEQGIAAYKAGNMVESRKLLAQAVKVERENELAWYYLSKTQSDPQKRRYCLEMALKLNPDNVAARRDLDAIEGGVKVVERDDLRKSAATDKPSPSIRIPKGITGAPERLSLDYTQNFVRDGFQESVATFTLKSGLANTEASWWRVVFTVGLTGFAIGLIYVLVVMLNVLQMSQFGVRLPIAQILITPFLTILMALVAFGAGAFISHWFLTTQRGGMVSQLDHAMMMAKIWSPASLLLAIVTVIGALFGRGIATLENFLLSSYILFDVGTIIFTVIALAIAGYAAYLMVKGMQRQNASVDDRSLWLTAAIMLVVTAVVF